MKWLVPRLFRLERAAPTLQVTLRPTNTGDDWLTLPHHLAIRRDGFVPTGYEAQSLLRESLTAFAAPHLAQGERAPDALALLESQTRSGDLDRWLAAAAVQRIAQPRQRFAHFYIAYEAALAGEGVIVAPTLLTAADVAAGRLVAPWTGIIVPGVVYSIVMPATAAMRNRAAPFLEWLYPEIEALAHQPV
jgi:LysR family glycine cleavage system transcriptional activator